MTLQRKIVFACLYFSEGAPIGFLWLALPTRLRAAGVSIEDITALTAVLVLPWTFKFAWAPLVDVFQNHRWSLRHWIVFSQTIMGLTLVPMIFLDPIAEFRLMMICLLAHAFAAATQDVAIDALCVAVTRPEERGSINGWMQTGMLLGRAMFGGGALVMAPYISWGAVVMLLIMVTVFSAVLVMAIPMQEKTAAEQSADEPLQTSRRHKTWDGVKAALTQRNTWVGLIFALTGGACFKALEVMYGPFLIDRGFNEAEVGRFASLPMIALMICGSLLGGTLSDRFGRRVLVGSVLVMICAAVCLMAACDLAMDLDRSPILLTCLAFAAFAIGIFTSSSYAMFMDHTQPAVAATQFSAFMGMTNGCEAWTSWAAGRITADSGYPQAFLALCLVSMLSLILLPMFRHDYAKLT